MMKYLFFLLFLVGFIYIVELKLKHFFFQNMIFLLILIYLFKYPYNSIGWVALYYFMGLDIYSSSLILLSFWICTLMILTSVNNLYKLNCNYYSKIIILMLIFLVMCFYSMNLIMFYMFFESSLIPIFLMILGWGFQVDRIQAGFYMMLYTLVGSMPLFILIIFIYLSNLTLNMNYIEVYYSNIYMYLFMILAFLVKMPMYLVHLWLPKAHVEAPLVGSMILAGVMLKLGGYGLMRFMTMMLMMCVDYNKIIMVISLVGGVYSSLICLFQVDMKMLVAYSSIVHMSIFLSGVMTLYSVGYLGGIMIMISHGLCSSGLFCLVNINYERLNSRSLLLNKGFINLLPSLSLMWVLLCSSNMSFPPSLNLWGEIILINSLLIWDFLMMLFLMMILFMSASYSLYLYSSSQHGWVSELNYLFKSISVNEFMNLILHWVPLNILFISMYMFM